ESKVGVAAPPAPPAPTPIGTDPTATGMPLTKMAAPPPPPPPEKYPPPPPPPPTIKASIKPALITDSDPDDVKAWYSHTPSLVTVPPATMAYGWSTSSRASSNRSPSVRLTLSARTARTPGRRHPRTRKPCHQKRGRRGLPRSGRWPGRTTPALA